MEFEGDDDFELTEDVGTELEDEPLDEGEVYELASELLEVSSDEELDQFLGGLFRKIKKKLGPLTRPLWQNVGGLLKGAAKKLLPQVAGAAGTLFGGPLGGMVASQLVPQASKLLGLELEGLSPEDQELETAKQFVRLAGAALQNAAGAANGSDPASAAKSAVVEAARRYAPGLIAPRGPGARGRAQQGRWFRRGNRVVVVGV